MGLTNFISSGYSPWCNIWWLRWADGLMISNDSFYLNANYCTYRTASSHTERSTKMFTIWYLIYILLVNTDIFDDIWYFVHLIKLVLFHLMLLLISEFLKLRHFACSLLRFVSHFQLLSIFYWCLFSFIPASIYRRNFYHTTHHRQLAAYFKTGDDSA